MELRPCIPSELNPSLNVSLVTTVSGLDDIIYFLNNVDEFGFDIETNMVNDFFERRIRTIQIGNREAQFVIDLLAFAGSTDVLLNGLGGYYHSNQTKSSGLDYVRTKLQPFLETDKKTKVGHNLSFEYETLKWNLGLRIFGLYDTMLVEKVLYSGKMNFLRKDFWALDDLIGRYCGIQIDKTEQTSFDLCTPLTESQIIYAGLDTRLPISIKGAQTKSVNQLNLNRTIKIENDAIPAFSDMHLNGMLIDTDKWLSEISKVEEIHKKNIKVLDELFVPVMGKLHRPHSEEEERLCEKFWREEKDPYVRANYRKAFYDIRKKNKQWAKDCVAFEGEANVQYGSPRQILLALQKAGVKLANTNDEVLETLEGDPYVDAVREFRTTEKTLNSYGPAYLEKNINKNTGRIHAIFDQLGAETGRTSSRKPNMQNIDKDAAWRSCFVARPDKVILTIDYSGCIKEDSIVSTKYGWCKIQDHPQAIFKGNKSVLTLTTKRKYSLTCTPDHRIFTNNGWVETKDLKPGMWVALDRDVSFNKEYDSNMWLKGFWAGDGGSHNAPGTASFAAGHIEDQKELWNYIENILLETPRQWGESFTTTSQIDFMDDCRYLFNKKDLRLPLELIEYNDMANILSGLYDADGDVDKNKVNLTSKFINLVKDVQIALLSFGIMSTIVEGRGGFNINPNGFPYYRVIISDTVSLRNFKNNIGFNFKRKKEKLERILSITGIDAGNYIPISHTLLKGNDYKKFIFNHIHGRPYTRLKLERINNKQDIKEFERYHWDQIISIVDNNEIVNVYDILDQPEERFTSNGIIVHNCELRILAEVSGEKIWVDAFNAGWDVHSVGAEMIFGQKWKDAAEDNCAYYAKHDKCKCKLHKILRDYIKAINFGIAYGMEAGKLARKLKITKKEAQQLLIDYRNAFKQVTAWLDKAGKEAQALLKSVTLAGRIRFYPKPDWEVAKKYAFEDCTKQGKTLTNDAINRKYKSLYSSIDRQGKNSPIQGTNADMVKLSVGCGDDSNGMSLMWKRLEPEFGALLLSSVHDECVIEAWEYNKQEVFDFACNAMMRGGNEFLTKVKAEVDGSISNCWNKG